jgi:hypothetical protein
MAAVNEPFVSAVMDTSTARSMVVLMRMLVTRAVTPAWCCVLQGWAEEGLPGAMVKRWAVAEAWADAVANGTARPREYKARAGDLAVFSRGGDPRRGGQGHVARVVEDVDENGDYPAIGGNEGGAAYFGGEVLLTKRNTSDPTLVGWIVRST